MLELIAAFHSHNRSRRAAQPPSRGFRSLLVMFGSLLMHVLDGHFETAATAYWTACRRWPKAKITLRQENEGH